MFIHNLLIGLHLFTIDFNPIITLLSAPLPEEWRGYRDEVLSNITGIDGCVFVHASGFIGGNKTKEGVIKMAEKALKMLGKWKSDS